MPKIAFPNKHVGLHRVVGAISDFEEDPLFEFGASWVIRDVEINAYPLAIESFPEVTEDIPNQLDEAEI